jgi:hypothetical protein
MPLLRRFALLAVVAAGFAAISSPAFAAASRDGSLPFHLDSPNFRVHYQSDLSCCSGSAITQTQAGDIAALAERALTQETADGYPRPLSDVAVDGDARIDIYVEDYSSFPGVLGAAYWDNDALQTSGFIELAGNLPDEAFTQHTIAHELFHLIQFSMWLPPPLWSAPFSLSDAWLLEGSAEWMGYRADNYPAVSSDGLGPSDMALDCRDPIGTNMCDLTDDYLNDGYSRWPFFEYLTEKYGSSFVKDIFMAGFNGGPSMTALSAVAAALSTKGTTLADAYNAWELANLTSSYSTTSLKGVKPQAYGPAIFTGVATTTADKPVTSQKVAVNHLSTRFLEFVRGPAVGGKTSTTCWQATLQVTVTFPVATLSQPVFYWDGPGSLATPLSINNGTATASIPWDTCAWDEGEGFLSLPNASSLSATQNVDAADFNVTVAMTVDASHQVTSIVPATPPPPVVVTSPVVPVSTLDLAPTIAVFGPQLLKLSATTSQIRLIVNASGQGLVTATLGSLSLGTANLRAGNNDVRFTVPKGALATLRRSAAASNVLTLTPAAATGTATGPSVTRTISVEPVKPTVVKKVLVKKAPTKKTAAKKVAPKKTPTKR